MTVRPTRIVHTMLVLIAVMALRGRSVTADQVLLLILGYELLMFVAQWFVEAIGMVRRKDR